MLYAIQWLHTLIAVWIMPVGLLLVATAIAAAVGRFYFATRRQTD